MRSLRRLRGGPPLDPGPFQHYVLERLRESFPEHRFAPTTDPQIVRLGDFQLGLQNLYANYRKADVVGEALDGLVDAHFEMILANLGQVEGHPKLTWEQARDRVRPQFMPSEYTSQSPIVQYPFHAGIQIGIVLDRERGYSYVKDEDLAAWGQSPILLYDEAIGNLERATSGVQIHAGANPDRYLAVEAKDGYDAVRILLPGFRQFIIQHLGDPFLASIANRDFLVAWAMDCTPRFHEFARSKAHKDFGEQPYPLTPELLRVSATTIGLVGTT